MSPRSITSPLASWLPFHKPSLNEITRLPSLNTRFRSQTKSGSKCLILNRKVAVEGLLWEIVPFHDLILRSDALEQSGAGANNKKAVPSQVLLLELLVGAGGKKTKSGQFCFLPLLVRVLFALERRDILELIVVVALRRRLSSPNEIFSILSELEEWICGIRP
jgi:hypothetical protein